MKAFLANTYFDTKYEKVIRWGKLVTITGTAQVIAQVIGFICGLFVIRSLSTEEYALYTVANTMLGTMIIIAEGGISTGVLAQGGRVYQDRKRLGEILSTGIHLRKKFASGSLLFAIPVLLFLLIHHGASWLMSSIIILALIPAFYASLSATLLEIPSKLHQDITPLQTIQIKSNLGRLILLTLTIFAFPWASVALLTTALPQLWANRRLKKVSTKFVQYNQLTNPEIKKEILIVVKRILPGSVYFCISGQFTIWIISIFGSTTSLAHLGALGRLSMLVTIFSVIFYTLVLPRFARLTSDLKLILTKYVQIQAGLLALCITFIGVIWMFSAEILWILGENYSGLANELVLLMIGTCLSFIVGASFYLCTSRAWVINPMVSIPINIASIILGAAIIDISSLEGILILNIFVSIIQAIMNILFSLFMILKIPG